MFVKFDGKTLLQPRELSQSGHPPLPAGAEMTAKKQHGDLLGDGAGREEFSSVQLY